MNILSFDTGLNIGWSIVDNNTEAPSIKLAGSKTFPSKISMENYCYLLQIYLNRIYNIQLVRHKIDKIQIELPEAYNSAKSKISMLKGDLFYPYTNAITIMNFFLLKKEFICSSNIKFLTPTQWKGQITKKATTYRLQQILKQKLPKNEHILDSIALGISENQYLWGACGNIK